MTVDTSDPVAVRRTIEAGLCPFCRRGPFAMIAVHTNKAHGVDKWALRDLAHMTTEEPLCLPETSARMREALDLERNAQTRAKAVAAKRSAETRPRFTKAGIASNTRHLREWAQRNPDLAAATQRRAARARTAEGEARRIAAVRQYHAENPLSDEERAAFRARMASPEALAKQREASAARRKGHGTAACYKRGCRRDECRAARAASRRR